MDAKAVSYRRKSPVDVDSRVLPNESLAKSDTISGRSSREAFLKMGEFAMCQILSTTQQLHVVTVVRNIYRRSYSHGEWDPEIGLSNPLLNPTSNGIELSDKGARSSVRSIVNSSLACP